jgi:type I restriction enzyme S subunit
MTPTLTPYPAYKDSGVPWLGQVPEHWEVVAGRGCLVEKNQPNIGLVETAVLSLSYGRIVVKPPERLRGLVPASFETYQIVNPGDIVCRPTDLQNDQNSLRFGLVRRRGIITSAYMSFRTTNRLDSKFGYFLLHAYDVTKIFYGLGSGLRQNLDWGDFKGLPCLIPPLPEQTAIVRFLEHMDRRIRRVIHARQRQIRLLEEYRQALIHQAVTGQIDVRTGEPYAAYKDSGVPWLGQVPAHWEVRRLKRYFTVAMGQTILASELDDNGKYPVFSATEGDNYFGKISTPKFILHSGDLVIPARGVSIGSVKIVNEPCVCTQTTIYAKRKCDERIDSKYIFYFSRGCREWLFEYDRTAIPQLTVEQVRNNPMLVIPLPEQTAIVECPIRGENVHPKQI